MSYYQSPDAAAEHRGFPNAATDVSLQALDLNQLLIQNPVSTFMMRIAGNDFRGQGIFHGDLVIIDRAMNPKQNDLVAWLNSDEFAISPRHRLSEEALVWGVVTSVIHEFRTRP